MAAITYLTQTKVEMGNAKAFGVMPSVKADAKEWKATYPQFASFLEGANYSKSIPTVPDIAKVLGDFNQQLQNLPNTDAKSILDRVNSELQTVLNAQ
jgi:multiple sugar transport system substrate-binding protein